MEYENLMFGQNEDALFALEDINKNRKLMNAFYPINNLDYAELKNKRKEPLKNGEIRILGVDLALMGGKNNDATIISCVRLIPNGDSYIRKVSYIESLEGGHTEIQAMRIRQIFEDFQASYIALDTGGNGLSIYDELGKVTYDEERDTEYDAWCAFNDDEMRSRVRSSNPLPVIFSIKGNRNLNHEIATSLRVNLRNSNIELPINELDANEVLREKKYYQNATPERKADYLRPFAETTRLVNELVNLNHTIVGGKIVVEEKSGKRKDRYSSLAYANFLAKHLESKNLSNDKDEWDLTRTYIRT